MRNAKANTHTLKHTLKHTLERTLTHTLSHTLNTHTRTHIYTHTHTHTHKQTWEWREGRLLAYELVLGHLVRDHATHMFRADVPPKPSIPYPERLGAGVDLYQGPPLSDTPRVQKR